MELRDLDIESTREPRRRFGNGIGPGLRKKSLILKAAGALLLIISVIVFFGGGKGDRNTTRELEKVKSRLDGLKDLLDRVGAVDQRISSTEREIEKLQALVGSLEKSTKSMTEKMEKLAQTTSSSLQPQLAAPQKKQTLVKKQLHEVRQGETLFGIAKKYGMSSDEVRRINHLSKNSIQPGQKLIVDTGKHL